MLSWIRRAPLAPPALAYRAGTEPRVPRKTPVEALSFLVLDAETSGFDPVRDRILSLAAVPVRAGTVPLGALQSWLVYQPRARLTDAVGAVTG